VPGIAPVGFQNINEETVLVENDHEMEKKLQQVLQ
jgi:hypothetical protein